MLKREQFAVSLRKKRRQTLIAEKRQNYHNKNKLSEPQANDLGEYNGYWSEDREAFYDLIPSMIPEFDFKKNDFQLWPKTQAVVLNLQKELAECKVNSINVIVLLTILR